MENLIIRACSNAIAIRRPTNVILLVVIFKECGMHADPSIYRKPGRSKFLAG